MNEKRNKRKFIVLPVTILASVILLGCNIGPNNNIAGNKQENTGNNGSAEDIKNALNNGNEKDSNSVSGSNAEDEVQKEPSRSKPPFKMIPEMPEYKMPTEEFTDPLEKEASEIIDESICKAISYVIVLKDDRHSSVSFPYEEDPHGNTVEFTDNQRWLYDYLVDKGRNLEEFKISDKEYEGDLIKDYLTISGVLWECNPDLDSYCSQDCTTDRNAVQQLYFDPYQNISANVKSGKADFEQIKHDIGLMNHIVKRIVNKMPENLSTYDKYYYLAAVLTEHITYDKEPKNAHTAFGALVCGRCVCEGYSEAYMLLCKEANLWCAYRWGSPDDSKHQWNMVKLDSGIYNVDLTWCDPLEAYRKRWYDYFMLNDEEFENHEITKGIESTGKYEPNPYQEQ